MGSSYTKGFPGASENRVGQRMHQDDAPGVGCRETVAAKTASIPSGWRLPSDSLAALMNRLQTETAVELNALLGRASKENVIRKAVRGLAEGKVADTGLVG
jgi:hypothetical protein